MDSEPGDEADPPRGLMAGPLRESTLGATTPASVPPEGPPSPPASRGGILIRIVGLIVGLVTLYFLLPQLLDVWEQIPRLTSIKWWFVVILPLEAGSFACQWKLTRTALPQVTWFVAGTAQLTSNAVSKVVPGGAAVGARDRLPHAVGVRGQPPDGRCRPRRHVDRVERCAPRAARRRAGWVRSSPPPYPGDLAVIAWGGALLFLVLFGLVFTLVRFDRPLQSVGRTVERVGGMAVAPRDRRRRGSGCPRSSTTAARPRRCRAAPRRPGSCCSATSWSATLGPVGAPRWRRRSATGDSTTSPWSRPSTPSPARSPSSASSCWPTAPPPSSR